MKTPEQIQAKIKEHESLIKKHLKHGLNDDIVKQIEYLLIGRLACLWQLSDEELINIDDYTLNIRYELLCFESTKIF